MRCILPLLAGLLLGTIARAELPSAVLHACLSPELTEHASATTWQILTPERWETQPTAISEAAGITRATQPGLPHPNGWVETTLSLEMPEQTDACPNPMQRFTIEARPNGALPKTTLDFRFLSQAKLPPYTVTTWCGRPALVALAGDWYIVADSPQARLIKTDEPQPKTTLILANQTTERRTPLRATICVGEGPLPAPTPER